MKIEAQNMSKNFSKMFDDPSVCEIGITPDVMLLFNRKNQMKIGNYLLYLNGDMYACNGEKKYWSADIPQEGIKVCIKTSSKLAVHITEDSVEYITPKKEVSNDFKFLLFAVHPMGLEFILADGAVSSEWFYRVDTKSERNILFYDALIRIVLNKFDAEKIAEYNKIFREVE